MPNSYLRLNIKDLKDNFCNSQFPKNTTMYPKYIITNKTQIGYLIILQQIWLFSTVTAR